MLRRFIVFALALLAACKDSPPPPPAPRDAGAAEPRPLPVRVPIDGRAFPDGVVALTWDDGPDANTVELATFLAQNHVSATFFVVGEWKAGVSEEPGKGTNVFETGFMKLPVLADLLRLGHRVGNHTQHHVLLGSADSKTVAAELATAQRALDRVQTNHVHLFRAPGGSWSASASGAVDEVPWLARLVGPIGWDIDRKDWEGSLYCRSDHPEAECEHGRVRADVMAKRYLESIVSAGHGIVLLHDRVGDVGSRYAIDVAKLLVPELLKRGFVFAPPVLRFGALVHPHAEIAQAAPSTLAGDIDGDGAADLCSWAGGSVVCARGNIHVTNGNSNVTIGNTDVWSNDFASADPSTLRLGDLNGDGRADVCGVTPSGVACALSTGHRFARATVWLDDLRDADPGTFALHDVTGDGRVDACFGSRCAPAP
ncbi:MAG TPA: polysaccharide deacetylase family protein [Labilithrix sp.]